MEYGLKRIILIDSYLPNRSYEVDMDGHTNITGENDIGKTSLIKLAVLFYGESPINVGIKVNTDLKRKSFSGYYLPRDGSFVVFEYLSQGNKKLLVFLPDKHSEDGFKRYFIDSGYCDTLFLDGVTSFSPDLFIQNLERKGIRTHRIKSFEEHRSILLDGNVKHQLHFAMVPSRTRLSKLYRLFTGMFKREASFDVLCKIIETWASDEIDTEAKTNLENFKLDKTKLKSWLHDYFAHKEIDNSLDLFSVLRATFDNYNHENNQFSGAYYKAGDLIQSITKALIELDQEQDKLLKVNSDNTIEAVGERNAAMGDVDKTEGSIQGVDTKLTSLLGQKSLLENELGNDYHVKLSVLPSLQGKMERINSQISTVNKGNQEIDLWYLTETGSIGFQFNEHNTACNKALTTVIKAYHEKIQSLQDAFLKEQRRLDQDKTSSCNALANEKMDASTKLKDTERNIANPIVPTDIQQSQEKLKVQVESAQEKQEELLRKVNDTAKKINLAKTLYDKENDELVRLEDDYDLLHKDFESTRAILECEDGSLLSFLKLNVPNWQDLHGRLLHHDVLKCTKLNPSISNGSTDSVLGVEIDVSYLPLNRFGTEGQLREKYNQLEKDLDAVEKAIRKQEKVLEVSLGALNVLKEDEKLTGVELRQVDNEVSTLKQQSQSQKHELAKLVLRYRNEQEAIRTGLQETLEQLESQIAACSTGFDRKLEALQSKLAAEKKEFVNDHQEQERKLNEQISQLSMDKEKSLSEVQEVKNQRLLEKGVDTESLLRLQKELGNLRLEKEALQALSEKAIYYEKFLKEEFSKHLVYKSDINTLSEQLESFKTLYETLSKACNKLSDEKASLEKIYSESKLRLHAQKTSLQTRIINNINEGEVSRPNNEIFLPDDPVQLVKAFDASSEQRRHHKSDLESLASKLKSVFMKHKDTQINNYWTTNPANTDDIISVVDKLLHYVENDYFLIDKKTLINNLSPLDKLSTYRDYIESFERRIKYFNKQLNEYMVSATDFHGLDDLKAEIVFSLSKTSTWADITNLTDKHKAWYENNHEFRLSEDSGTKKLPNESFVSALENFLEYSGNEEMSTSMLYRYLDFKLAVVDKGELKNIKSHKQLPEASSNATSYLIMLVLFIGFVNMQRKDANVTLTWALDELKHLDNANIQALLSLLSANNINILSACPDTDKQLYDMFNKSYVLEENEQGDVELASSLYPDDVEGEVFL